jgi:excisionase family DNA binding protein
LTSVFFSRINGDGGERPQSQLEAVEQMKTIASDQSSVVADGLVTVGEAARFLGIGRSKLYSLMDAGELAFVKLGRARRVPRAALVKLAEANLVAVGS